MNKDAAERMVDQIMDEVRPEMLTAREDVEAALKERIRQVVRNWMGV